MDELQRHLSKLPDQEDVPGLVPGPAIDDGQCLEDDLCCGQDDLWHILWPGFGVARRCSAGEDYKSC
jgi:hypothetical protein